MGGRGNCGRGHLACREGGWPVPRDTKTLRLPKPLLKIQISCYKCGGCGPDSRPTDNKLSAGLIALSPGLGIGCGMESPTDSHPPTLQARCPRPQFPPPTLCSAAKRMPLVTRHPAPAAPSDTLPLP